MATNGPAGLNAEENTDQWDLDEGSSPSPDAQKKSTHNNKALKKKKTTAPIPVVRELSLADFAPTVTGEFCVGSPFGVHDFRRRGYEGIPAVTPMFGEKRKQKSRSMKIRMIPAGASNPGTILEEPKQGIETAEAHADSTDPKSNKPQRNSKIH
jgi:hypothetical protein